MPANNTDLNLNVIFEDSDMLILNKPVNVVVNRSKTHSGGTVQDFIEGNYTLIEDASLSEADLEYGDEFKLRSGIVHRLDKDTSGVLLIAKKKSVFLALQKQFKDREVKKEYRAVVIGGGLGQNFEIDAPLDRNPRNRLTMAVVQQGNPAKTICELLQNFEIDGSVYSHLRVFPLTGRTHQIRVHLAALNHPVAGDPLYCSKVQYESTTERFGRMMLHALSIEFNHPTTTEVIKAEAPLPEEFVRHVAQ